MNILVLNSGSSSLKFQVINAKSEKVLEKGQVDGIGLTSCKIIINGNERKSEVKNHSAAIKEVFKDVDLKSIKAVGHRVVHGGEFYSKATIITPSVIKKIKALSELAPLHNPPNLAGILACKKALPKVKQVAVFDTAFHQTIPIEAYMYGIPIELYKKYKIRKYGFHGTSHKYVMQQMQKILKKKNVNIITCHLGNGSSITAIKNGKSFDTTMGFTPLQGLIMGTRCGDIDAEVVPFLMDKEKLSAHEVLTLLNKKSGLKGICREPDVRNILKKAKNGNKKAKLALDMLAFRIVEYIGAYSAIIGHLDAIVFTAGIGENEWHLRKKVCETLGYHIDKKKNRENSLRIGHKVFVVPTNEELMIAKETLSVIK